MRVTRTPLPLSSEAGPAEKGPHLLHPPDAGLEHQQRGAGSRSIAVLFTTRSKYGLDKAHIAATSVRKRRGVSRRLHRGGVVLRRSSSRPRSRKKSRPRQSAPRRSVPSPPPPGRPARATFGRDARQVGRRRRPARSAGGLTQPARRTSDLPNSTLALVSLHCPYSGALHATAVRPSSRRALAREQYGLVPDHGLTVRRAVPRSCTSWGTWPGSATVPMSDASQFRPA
jgi:hypothetical protein